jgi:cell division initiation protein
MKITPLEIRQKTFEKVFRGYEKDEVNAYLQSLSMEWERMLDENKELHLRIENLQTESTKLRELESSLFKTLKTAEDTGATLIEQAKKETDLKIKESSLKAEAILNEARSKAKSLIEQADERKKQVLDEMISKVKTLENLFNQMLDLKEKVVDQVKSYSNDLTERIEKLEKKSEELQIKDIVSEAKHIYHSTSVGITLDFLKNDPEIEDKAPQGSGERKDIVDTEESGDSSENRGTFGGEIEIEVDVSAEEKIEEEKEVFSETIPKEKEEDNMGKPKIIKGDDEQKTADQNGADTENKSLEESPDEQKEKKSASTSFFDEID